MRRGPGHEDDGGTEGDGGRGRCRRAGGGCGACDASVDGTFKVAGSAAHIAVLRRMSGPRGDSWTDDVSAARGYCVTCAVVAPGLGKRFEWSGVYLGLSYWSSAGTSQMLYCNDRARKSGL